MGRAHGCRWIEALGESKEREVSWARGRGGEREAWEGTPSERGPDGREREDAWRCGNVGLRGACGQGAEG
eukprot:5403290-Prymnesium_polylepis.3